jgi:hypothetical protein
MLKVKDNLTTDKDRQKQTHIKPTWLYVQSPRLRRQIFCPCSSMVNKKKTGFSGHMSSFCRPRQIRETDRYCIDAILFFCGHVDACETFCDTDIFVAKMGDIEIKRQ